MQADMRVLRLARGASSGSTPSPRRSAAVRRHLETYKIGREVEIEDVGAERAILSLIGPRSRRARRHRAPLPEHACEARRRRRGRVPRRRHRGRRRPDRRRRRGATACASALLAAGAVEVGDEAAEIVRIEAGIPRFGAEMSTETMPAEAGIVEAAVSFTKGCYIGQEPVARLHYKGRPNRHLRGLRLSAPVERRRRLRLGEKEVGRIGSACVSPALGPIALAIVRREAEPGAELAVGEDGVTARVVDLPFG